MPDSFAPETRIALAGVGTDQSHAAVSPPLHLAATYRWESPHDKPGFDYSRSGNPTRTELENALAELEGAARCIVTSSGMSAINLVLDLIRTGERIIAPHDCYGGTYRLLAARAAQGHFEIDFVDQTDDDAYSAALKKGAALVLIETPSNPLLRIVDIKKRAAEAREAGALIVADNTFLSPARQNPIALGCDLVVHSTTKFINGHSDVVGGATLAATPELGEEIAYWANATGITGAPFDSYQTLRGLRTLFPRIAMQESSALQLANVLNDDPRIARVYFPGLQSHPGRAIAAGQQSGFGSMLSIELAEDIDPVAFVKNLRIFTIAESLGGFESLVCLPATMTHASMPAEARRIAGIADSLVRLSIGLEHAQDLLADLDQALSGAKQILAAE